MIITHYREKLINSIIYFTKNTKKLGKTKLMKLLYSLDFVHFKETGKSVTGLEYFAWERGPVAKELWKELTNTMQPDMKHAINIIQIDDFQKIVSKAKFNDYYFSKREKRLLNEISEIYKEANANQMVEISHLRQKPFDKTLRTKGKNQKIDYLLAIDDKDENSLEYEEAKERMDEIAEMHTIFGTV
ncbi:MAG: SocA family protein [Deltaproteobacteria bacterium]|nr:SocA family protein [Deltaproteobacteria bacterium]MBW2114655.1 SocA family protein [Deltaproteobacteria bacterium]